MTSSWEKVPVSRVASIYIGGTPSRSVPKYWGSDIKWASAKDVASCTSRYIRDTQETISTSGLQNSATKVLDKDTVVITARGTVGAVCMLAEAMAFNQTCYGLVAKQSTNPAYLYYALKASLSMIGSISYGTVFNTITMRSFDILEIPHPPLLEQRAIAHILGVLDDKIELNHQTNQTLEAMAQALFKRWFVDFEPFRDQGMQKSSQGEIPAGWKVEPLGNNFEVVRGLSHKGEYLSDNGMPLHNLNSVYEGGGYKYEGIKFYNGEYQDNNTVLAGDVIVTNTEQGFEFLLIGYPAIVPRCFGRTGLFSHHLFRLRPFSGSPLTNHFIYLLLKTRTYHDIVAGYTNGTTVNMLQQNDLRRLPIIVPTEEVGINFDRLTAPLMKKTEQNHDESNLLTALRDTLLPRLLSGEIRVKDAEKYVENRV
jgi:type I restriction enzyme S subunit